jgi:hypothetical protein
MLMELLFQYVVTYSKEDNSIQGWSVNAEKNGEQQCDVYFKADKPYIIDKVVLRKKILLFIYRDCERFRKYLFWHKNTFK